MIRPNADTLYSSAWLDLSREPVLIHVPDSGGRFYLLQFMDAWTETFAAPGKRTTGTAGAWFAIVGPNGTGTLPEHVTRFDSATNTVWLLGRTQTNGAADYGNVRAFQQGMRIMPLSAYPNGAQQLGSASAFGSASGGTPPDKVKAMDPLVFFAAFARPREGRSPQYADTLMVRDLARIGIVPGRDFDASLLSAGQRQAIQEGVHAASVQVEGFITAAAAGKPGWAGLKSAIGRYGTDYMARAAIARFAIGANPPEDASLFLKISRYRRPRGHDIGVRYRMRHKDEVYRQCKAFWSMRPLMIGMDTFYRRVRISTDTQLGDRDPLKLNPDGSLDLYLQNESPGPGRESNWLPTCRRRAVQSHHATVLAGGGDTRGKLAPSHAGTGPLAGATAGHFALTQHYGLARNCRISRITRAPVASERN